MAVTGTGILHVWVFVGAPFFFILLYARTAPSSAAPPACAETRCAPRFPCQVKRLSALRTQPLQLPPIPIEFDMVTPQVRHVTEFARGAFAKLPAEAQTFAPAALGIAGVRTPAHTLPLDHTPRSACSAPTRWALHAHPRAP